MTSYAANGTREQHRAYFDESGRLLYHGRRLLKGPGYFGPSVEDLKELVKMDPKKDFAEATQGCKEVKSAATHRTRKNWIAGLNPLSERMCGFDSRPRRHSNLTIFTRFHQREHSDEVVSK
jgi:hypothetical protein